MPREERLQLIGEIERMRESRVLCFLTGDRRRLETRIHPEVHSMFYDHLQNIGQTESIDLYLYSTGGVTMAAWSIANLVREFCENFRVIVPYKAFSTATLICLGANEIIMGKLGQLGPVDPSVNMPFNPPSPGNQPGQVLPISVEEVKSFIEFSKDDRFVGLKSETALCNVLKHLTDKIHPLALGSVYRAIEQIKMLSTKLLKLHMPEEEEEAEINRIVEALTKSLYSHDYIINRREAKEEIKLKITDAESIDANFDRLIYDLFKEYENEMCLTSMYNPETILGTEDHRRDVFYRAFIESRSRADAFVTEKEFRRIQQAPPIVPAPQTVIQEKTLREGWEEIS